MARDPYRHFRIEARELLDQLGSGVLELEKGGGDADLSARLLRYAHTLKGAARVVRQAKIAELSHALEDALLPLRQGEPPSRDSADTLLRLLDAMAAELARLPQADAAPVADAVVEELPPLRLGGADMSEVDALLDGLGEIGTGLTALHQGVAAVERARDLAASTAEQLAALRVLAARSGELATPWEKLSLAADAMHELIAAAARNLSTDMDAVERELRQARDCADRLRLGLASGLFGILERTARDAARSLGKEVDFVASGGDVRLDTQVLGIVQGALVQMVRNAVAHGIETAAERRAAGKPVPGRIALQVERQGYRVCLRCTDDGRGVDMEAVRQALQRKGALSADLQGRDETQLLALLLRGGVSTASAVTELAGRGIGLDVVREAMRQLGGDVLASTRRGAGTTLALHVPVSLAALDVLGVQVDGQLAAIPLAGVRRSLRIAPQDVTHSPEGDAIVHEGALIALRRVRLSAARAECPARSQAISAIVVGDDAAAVALGVDRLHGTQRIVQRPLPALALAEAFVCGTYLHADGTPGIVLDPARLAAAARTAKFEAAAPARPIDPILIVDDSLTTRMLESSILESAGYAVELAASGEEAWTMARRTRYCLFLVDVEMPGMSGFDFVAGTRADPLLGSIPCILVTSRDSAEDRRRGEAAGAAAYIVKSAFEQDAFLQRVRSLVQR